MGRRVIDPALAAWMYRAGIPSDAIAHPFRTTPRAVRFAVERHRADLASGNRAAAKHRADSARMAWCPPEFVADYKALLRKRFSAAEARAIIERSIARRPHSRQAIAGRDTQAQPVSVSSHSPCPPGADDQSSTGQVTCASQNPGQIIQTGKNTA